MRIGMNVFRALSKINCILTPDLNSSGGLYLGDINGANNIGELKHLGVGAVLTCAAGTNL